MKRSIYKEASEYCKQNPDGFQKDLNYKVYNWLGAPFLFAVGSSFIAFSLYLRIGTFAFLALSPYLFLLTVSFLINRAKISMFVDISNYYFDFAKLSAIFGFNACYLYQHYIGAPNPNGPMQILIFACSLFPFNKSIFYLTLRNIFYGVASGVVFYFYDPAYFLTIKFQFFGGMICGITLCTYLHRSEKIRFFLYSQHKNKGNHLENELSKIVYPHQIEQINKGHQLESTMRTDPGHGIVLSFDIIGSSKIKHLKLKDFLESAIHDCMEILSHNYEANNKVISNGFRIKEMGDGFLCSIDYPFQVPDGKDPAILSVDLAYRFIQNLENNVETYDFPNPVYCGIGIASGAIQGYFPKSGTKEYDLFGRGIVLATRYESMRKSLFRKQDAHSIIIQTNVYESLPRERRKHFERYEIPKNRPVRDDAEAEDLYYELVSFGGLRQTKSDRPAS